MEINIKFESLKIELECIFKSCYVTLALPYEYKHYDEGKA